MTSIELLDDDHFIEQPIKQRNALQSPSNTIGFDLIKNKHKAARSKEKEKSLPLNKDKKILQFIKMRLDNPAPSNDYTIRLIDILIETVNLHIDNIH